MLLLFLVISFLTYGQVTHNPEWDNISIYEYGGTLDSCECNFENLFRNWDTWITNHEETKPVSYSYVETLKDVNRIDYYAALMCRWTATDFSLSSSTSQSSNGEMDTYMRKFHVRPGSFKDLFESLSEEQKKDSLKLSLFTASIEDIIEQQKEFFKKNRYVGDKVYLIRLKSNKKVYDHYVICRPEENRIVSNDALLRINGIKMDIDKWLK